MLAYTEDNKLITTSLGNPYRNIDLMTIHSDATYFCGKDNRFYKIISKDIVARDIKHLSRESMNRDAIRKFRDMTGDYDSGEYIDKENNIGYEVFPYMKKNPTIFTYSIVYPAITEFFRTWNIFSKKDSSKQLLTSQYDLSKLFASMDNFRDLSSFFLREDGEQLKKSLYQYFPEFAIFYYEIYPYLNFKILGNYDITKLVNTRLQVYELGLDTTQFDDLMSSLPAAENNTKVLKLIKNPKDTHLI